MRAPKDRYALKPLYHDGQRELQDRFDTRKLADRIEERLVHEEISSDQAAFIHSLDMFFLATVDAEGQPSCSYKGGGVGLVRVVNERELVFPSYDGNGMFVSLGNVLKAPKVGLLFIDFCSPKRLRVHGTARVVEHDPLLAEYQEAQLIVRVAVERVFPNCPRYIHTYQRVAPSEFVPRAECETPIPKWKQSDWAKDVLPANDPARKR